MRYIKSYKIFESNISPNAKSGIDKICKKYKIENYIINDDMSIDVNGDVDLCKKQLTKLPLKFNRVNGSFFCCDNNLISLEGSPNYVEKTFNVSGNKLISLKYCPHYVGGLFSCEFNNITSIEDYTGNYEELELRYGTPIGYLVEIIMGDLQIEIYEVLERLDEFDIINNNTIDLINLEKLYDFYNISKESHHNTHISPNIDKLKEITEYELRN